MKTRYLIASLLAAALTLPACEDEKTELVNTPAVNVTTEKLSPAADESGAVRAYIGTEVTAVGFNLDKVSKVTLGDVEAEISAQSIKSISFVVPSLDLEQADDPHRVDLKVYDADGETVVFLYDYYVTVPVTDAILTAFSPVSGTVGTVVSFTGRNLDQVTAVKFGSASVTGFVSKEAGEVTAAVPALSATAASTEFDVTVEWGSNTISATDKFTFLRPVFAAYTQAAEARLGDEFELTGENLDLVDSLKWGDYLLLISEQSATSITAKIPSGIEQADPAVVTTALDAFYGLPAVSVTVSDAFKVDTTPIGPAAPVFASVAPTDAAYDKIFLGREVTVKGENFASVEKFKIDGIEVELTEAATDIAAKFVVPRTITGTARKSVSLVAVWNGGNEADFGTVEVYPFYYTKGLRLRIGSNSKSTYPTENAAEAFLLLDEGRVVSVADFKSLNVDPYALSGTNTVTTSANKAAAGKETEYYGVQPYTFAIANSSHKLSFCDPGNSTSQLKCHFDNGTALPSTFGTPIIYFVVVSDADLKQSVSGGTLDNIAASVAKAGKAAPAYSSDWSKGDVLSLQYITYDKAATAAKPGDNLEGVRKTGYIVVTDITCVSGTGAATDRVGYIDLDLYWSNVL